MKSLFELEAVTANGLPSPGKFTGIMRESSADKAIDTAMTKLGERPGFKGARGKHRVDIAEMGERLKKLTNPEVATKVARRMANITDNVAYVKAVENILGTPSKISRENLTRILEESTFLRGDEPTKYLENVYKLVEREGLTPTARRMLIEKLVGEDAPDLAGWIDKTDLTPKELNFLATDPMTQWRSFMKVSAETSRDFSKPLAKRHLDDYAFVDAGSKTRGVAAEMLVDEAGLHGEAGLDGFKLNKRQIDVGDERNIDFGGTDPSGNECLLEVKAASKKTWKRSLDDVETELADPKSMLYRLDKQLRAAKNEARRSTW